MTKRITLTLLQAKGACQEEMDAFQERYPDGVIPTPDECEKVKYRFSFFWAAANLLTLKQQVKYRTLQERARAQYAQDSADSYAQRELAYAPLSAALSAVRDPAIAERNRKIEETGLDWTLAEHTAIWAEYKAAVDPAIKVYEAQAVLIDAAHLKAIGPAVAAYQTAKARAFGEVWCS
jgi:hypothetical protein